MLVWPMFQKIFAPCLKHWQPQFFPPLTVFFIVSGLFCWWRLVAVPWDVFGSNTWTNWLHIGSVFGCGVFGLFCFLAACHLGPGHPPPQWQPVKATPEELSEAKKQAELHHRHRYHHPVRYCSVCKGYKPPRAHHCSTCQSCNLRMDHHCEITNCCVGLRNQKVFLLWLVYTCISLLALLLQLLYRLLAPLIPWLSPVDSPVAPTPWTASQLGLLAYLVVVIYVAWGPTVVILLIQAVVAIARNVTHIEVWEKHWANIDCPSHLVYRYPYDKKSWFRNAQEVLGTYVFTWPLPIVPSKPDGLHYPTICGPTTLLSPV